MSIGECICNNRMWR